MAILDLNIKKCQTWVDRMLLSSEYLKALTEKTSKDTTRQEEHNFECGQESSCCKADFWTLCTKILATAVNRNGDWFIINRHLFSRVHETGHSLNAKHLAVANSVIANCKKGRGASECQVERVYVRKPHTKNKGKWLWGQHCTVAVDIDGERRGCQHICKTDLLYFHPWYRVKQITPVVYVIFLNNCINLNAHSSRMMYFEFFFNWQHMCLGNEKWRKKKSK